MGASARVARQLVSKDQLHPHWELRARQLRPPPHGHDQKEVKMKSQTWVPNGNFTDHRNSVTRSRNEVMGYSTSRRVVRLMQRSGVVLLVMFATLGAAAGDGLNVDPDPAAI